MSVFAAIIVLASLLTSVISGIFGMAGGLILMGVFTWMLPAASALALHGIIQFASNLWRLLLHRAHVEWRVLLTFGLGSALAMGLFALITWVPTKAFVFLVLGLLPILVWVPERWLSLDALNPWHSVVGGFGSTILSLLSGVSGPLTDVLFVRTTMGRHRIVATKAAMQAIGHASKILVYGTVLLSASSRAVVPLTMVTFAVLASMVGIVIGGRILDRMSDGHFKTARRWIVTSMGVIFLIQAAEILL
jgi:uncharacterized membrane protein YfcA